MQTISCHDMMNQAQHPVADPDGMRSPAEDALTDADYRHLAELRYGLRSFLHWSAGQAKRAGLTPTQHQLLLAVRASRHERGPTVSEVAAILLIRHHSAVELADRAQEAGLIVRERDPDQQAMVRLRLTAHGAAKLASLSELHLRELAQLAPTIRALLEAIGETEPAAGSSPGASALRPDPISL
jgi:DNA-binding MarR family transcriptional regulator